MTHEVPKLTQYKAANLLYIGIVANLGSFLYGFDFGATAWLIFSITTFSGGDDDGIKYFSTVSNSDGLLGLVAAGSGIGAIITYFVLLFCGNYVCKRDELLLSSLLYFVGALLESTAGSLSWSNWVGYAVLITGRFVYGGGIATSLHSSSQYLVQMGPAETRGMV